MQTNIMTHPGELFLGSTAATARALGPRRFSTAEKAVRFAMEHAAPVSLRGAQLRVGSLTLGPRQIRRMHREMSATTAPAQARQ